MYTIRYFPGDLRKLTTDPIVFIKKAMSDRFQCPRYNITLKNTETPESDEGLCDFCWYEYCFCWAEYCLEAWLQAQANSGSPTSNHNSN